MDGGERRGTERRIFYPIWIYLLKGSEGEWWLNFYLLYPPNAHSLNPKSASNGGERFKKKYIDQIIILFLLKTHIYMNLKKKKNPYIELIFKKKPYRKIMLFIKLIFFTYVPLHSLY